MMNGSPSRRERSRSITPRGRRSFSRSRSRSKARKSASGYRGSRAGYRSRSRSRSPSYSYSSRSRSRSWSLMGYTWSYYGSPLFGTRADSFNARRRNQSYYSRYRDEYCRGRWRSRSRSRSRSTSPYKRGGGRSHSRSPMSSRRRHAGHRVSPPSYNSGPNRGRPYPRNDSSRNARVLQENPGPNKCLGVFGLSLRTTERDLREVFTRYGPIDECTVVIDAQTGRSRGFSFIYFENIEDAKAAKESCNGIEIDGRRIRVDFSITQRAHTPTPGIYMGKPTMDGKPRRRRDDGYRGYNRRSPSPYGGGGRRRRHSRSRSYSPRRY